MKKIILVVILFKSVGLLAQAPGWEWAKSANYTGYAEGMSIAVDLSGNSYVAGNFYSDSIIFGSTILINSTTNSNIRDIFVVKYDSSGNLLWAKQGAGKNYDWANAITVDAAGNSYVAGSFNSDTLTFDNLILINTGVNDDIFIVKYDSSGNIVWAKSTGGNLNDFGTEVISDANGNFYITGVFSSSSIAFDTITFTGQSGYGNFFVVKYDSSGNVIWAKRSFGGLCSNCGAGGRRIAVDINGNSYVTGLFSGTVFFDSDTLISSDLNHNIFIVKYDNIGNVIWAKSASSPGVDYVTGISVDGIGNSYITGFFDLDSITFGNITLMNSPYNLYQRDLFIVKYDSIGNVIWAKSAGGNYDDLSWNIKSDTEGNSYIVGDFMSDTITFGTNIITNNNSPSAVVFQNKVFITKYDSSGNVIWVKNSYSPVGSYINNGYSIAIDINGNSFISGGFDEQITFGNTVLNTYLGKGFFIAKLDSAFLVGVPEQTNSANRINIFPNPTTSQVNITSSFIIDEIEITDIIGQVVYGATPYQKNVVVQMEHAGIYFVSLTSNNQTVTKKLVVQK